MVMQHVGQSHWCKWGSRNGICYTVSNAVTTPLIQYISYLLTGFVVGKSVTTEEASLDELCSLHHNHKYDHPGY